MHVAIRRNKTALLTLELVFHPSPHNLPSPSSPSQYTLLTHRNSLDIPLLVQIQRNISQRAQKAKPDSGSGIPSWVQELACPDQSTETDAYVVLTCYFRTELDPREVLTAASARVSHVPLLSHLATKSDAIADAPPPAPKFGYIKLDPTQKLSNVLRNKRFVEYPTIDIWEDGVFDGMLLDESGLTTDMRSVHDIQIAKRRRLSTVQGKKAISGLVGGYGSGSDDEEGTEDAQDGSAMDGLLGGYGSEEDSGKEPEMSAIAQALTEDGIMVGFGSDGSDVDDLEQDPAILAAQLEKIHGAMILDGDEEELDWGEDYDQET
jgi:hypothetical protein